MKCKGLAVYLGKLGLLAVRNFLHINNGFDLQQYIIDEYLRAFSNIFLAPKMKVVGKSLHLWPVRSVIPSSNQLVILLEMIRVASKALSKSLSYIQQKTILQVCSDTQSLLSRLFHQRENLYPQV